MERNAASIDSRRESPMHALHRVAGGAAPSGCVSFAGRVDPAKKAVMNYAEAVDPAKEAVRNYAGAVDPAKKAVMNYAGAVDRQKKQS